MTKAVKYVQCTDTKAMREKSIGTSDDVTHTLPTWPYHWYSLLV